MEAFPEAPVDPSMVPTAEVPLGEEHFFKNLITDHVKPEIRQSLVDFKINSVLDIGCGTGEALVMMHYLVGCNYLRGVEAHGEEHILGELNKTFVKPFASLDDFWLGFKKSPTDLGEQIPDKNWLNDNMYVAYGRFLNHWQPPKGIQFDAIIASQVVHFLMRRELLHLFSLIKRLLRSGGMIYISMKTEFAGNAAMPQDISEAERFDLCSAFAKENRLTYHRGTKPATDGNCHTWTNLKG